MRKEVSVRSPQAADDKSTQLYLTRRIAYPIRQQASTLSGLPRKFGDSRHAVRRRAGSFALPDNIAGQSALVLDMVKFYFRDGAQWAQGIGSEIRNTPLLAGSRAGSCGGSSATAETTPLNIWSARLT